MNNPPNFPLAQMLWAEFYRKKYEYENQALDDPQPLLDPLREVREAIRYTNLARHDE